MHIFSVSVTYLQSAEKIQWKLYEELTSQSLPYQPLLTCSHRKMAKVKNLVVSLSKTSFSASNFFMHIFNMSVTYLQNAEKIQWKLLMELISQSMPYQPLFTWCSHPKMAK